MPPPVAKSLQAVLKSSSSVHLPLHTTRISRIFRRTYLCDDKAIKSGKPNAEREAQKGIGRRPAYYNESTWNERSDRVIIDPPPGPMSLEAPPLLHLPDGIHAPLTNHRT
ncbi:hypothetical protein NPIL_391161 [Nephila pilipes]|uniref:Uncharacterized protein n=1 Tax=Nephila pilipes TaxID=299642 RepID=A0A8X6NX38_NEPPI|nr:hypothetical protein NPIL_391161 [Nephila pilipes]